MVYNQVQYVQFNTYGNTARKIAQAPARSAALPEARTKQKTKVICVDPVAVLSIAVAVCMVLTMTVGIFQLAAARKQAAQMETYVQQLSTQNQALTAKYTAGYDLQQVEKSALALGMVPREQVQTVSLELPAVEQEARTTVWDHIGTMLTTLFA